MIARFKNVKISAISAVVPKKEISIYDEAQYYDNNVKKIDRMRKMVGFNKRRVVENGVTAADLAYEAALNMINEQKIDKAYIDALIFVRQRPDYNIPATAFSLHKKLGFGQNTMALDISLGCSGWMQALFTAFSMVESGACKKVLLCAGDTPSVDIKPENRTCAPIFGDGGSATLVEFTESETNSYFDLGADGSAVESIATPSGGYRLPIKDDSKEKFMSKLGYETDLTEYFMDGGNVFALTMKYIPDSIKRLLDYAKITNDKIDHLILHQANKQIIQTITEKSGFPPEMTLSDSFENYGNQSVTSLPIAINHNQINNGKVLCSGFGNGFGFASAIIDFDNVFLSGVREYSGKPTERREIIEKWKNIIEGVKNE